MIWISFLSLSSCKSEAEIKYEQYVIGGKSLYETHCANCHGKNGEGLQNLYPSINKSEKLGDFQYLKCLIKNGTVGFETNMPANKELYDLDIAQIITYMRDKWTNSRTLTETQEIAKINC